MKFGHLEGVGTQPTTRSWKGTYSTITMVINHWTIHWDDPFQQHPSCPAKRHAPSPSTSSLVQPLSLVPPHHRVHHDTTRVPIKEGGWCGCQRWGKGSTLFFADVTRWHPQYKLYKQFVGYDTAFFKNIYQKKGETVSFSKRAKLI